MTATSIFFGVMFMAVAMVVFACAVLLIYLGLSAAIDRFIYQRKEYPNE